MYQIDAECMEKNLDDNFTSLLRALELILEVTYNKTIPVWIPSTHLENHLNYTN